jgi:prolyl oligopeptidase
MEATFFWRRKWNAFSLPALFAVALYAQNSAQTVRGGNGVTLPPPPSTPMHSVDDEYQGTRIEDPYRWLEDAKSPQTRAWIDIQNKYTQQYLAQLKNRPEIVQQLTELERVDQYSLPAVRGGKYFFEKRLAGENQASIYVREGWKGTDSRLIDATKLSADQNTSVRIDDIAKNGSLLVYGVRQGGADEQSVHVIDVRDRKELPDVLPSARYFSVSLGPEDKGIYYSVFTHQGTNVYFHRFGTAVQSDSKIFGGEYRGEQLGEIDLIEAWMSDNDRYLMVNISHGVPPTRDDILVKDLRRPESDFVPLVYGIEAQTRALNIGDRFFLETDYQAANKRIVEALPGGKPEEWKTIIPEGKDHRWIEHRGGQALRHSPARRQDRDKDLYPERPCDRHHRLSWNRLELGGEGTLQPGRGFLQLFILHTAANHFPLRHQECKVGALRCAQGSLRHFAI